MRRNNFVVLLFSFMYFSLSCQSPIQEDKKATYSKSDLEKDFKQLVDQLETHPQVNAFISASDWKAFKQTQKKQLRDQLTIEEFYRICLPLVARVGCGHTNLYNLEYNAATKKALVYLPYRFLIEDQQLYVVENLSENKSIPLGAKIESINEESIQDIIDFIVTSMPADGYNKSYQRRMASKGFTYYYHALYGIIDYNKITYSHQGVTKGVDFKCSELVPLDGSAKKDEDQLSLAINEELNTGIIKVKTFSFYNNVSVFHNFVDSTFRIIKERNIEQVIIDLRGNQGGDPYCSSYLLRAIANKPIQYYKDDKNYPELLSPQKSLGFELKNKPFVLIDGFGFSSTGHLAALIKEHDLGIFIGEELGSTYSCNGAQNNTILKNTGLFLQVGQKMVDVMVDPTNFDKTIGILPDVRIESSYQSVLSNKDVVMDEALEMIRASRSK